MERIAVFSDVHADANALRSLLDDARRRGITHVWCLGDFCSGGPQPRECFDLVRTHCEIVLIGNHEQFVTDRVFMHLAGGWADSAYRAYLALGEERVGWLRAQPAHHVLAPWGVELVHASLRDPLYTFMDKPADIYLNLPLASQPTVLFGHSHQSACFAATERGLPTSLPTDIDVAQPLPYGRTCLLNPGCGCDEEGARWLELQLDGAERIAIWRQTAVSGHGGLFSITP